MEQPLLSDRELAAGIAMAVEEQDFAWLKAMIGSSEAGQGMPPEMLDEFVLMIMGREFDARGTQRERTKTT